MTSLWLQPAMDPALSRSHAAMYEYHLLTAVATIDCLLLDEEADSDFIEHCLQPLIAARRAQPNYQIEQAKHAKVSRQSVARQAAVYQRVTYTGSQVLRVASSSVPQAAAVVATPAEVVAPNPNELNTDVGGVIVISRRPYVASRESEREYEQLMLQAQQTGRWTLAIEKTRSRARALFESNASLGICFDKADLRSIMIDSYNMARNNNIEPPRQLTDAVTASMLAIAGFAPPLIRQYMQQMSSMSTWLRYIDFGRLEFYASALRCETHVQSVVRAHVVASEIAAEQDAAAAEEAEEQSNAALEREFGDIEEQHDDADSEESSLHNAGGALLMTVDKKSRTSVASSTVTSSSINARVAGGAASQERHYKRTPYRALLGDDYEFADRLRGSETSSAMLASDIERMLAGTSFKTELVAPQRLVRRFTLALACQVRLIERYYDMQIALANPLDYFHLFMLSELEIKTRQGDGAQISPATRTAIASLVASGVALRAPNHIALQSPLAGAEHIEALVQSVVAHSDDVERVAALLFENEGIALHRSIEAFQVQTELTVRQRRSRAELVKCSCVPYAELAEYITRHALSGVAERIAALDNDTRYEPISQIVLRMSASDATPLALTSSIRAHVPSARDGDDYLVVWTPSVLPPNDGYIYVAMRRPVWRRIMLGALPCAVAEQRSVSAVTKGYPTLVAAQLARSMRDADDDIKIDALRGVQALSSCLQRALPMQWQVGKTTCRQHARSSANALMHVADALASGAGGRSGTAIELVKVMAQYKLTSAVRTTEESCIFSAVHAAISGTNCCLFMIRSTAARYLERERDVAVPAFYQFIESQLRATAPAPDYQPSETCANADGSCACGTPLVQCERLRWCALTKRSRRVCCICLRLPRTTLQSRRERHAERYHTRQCESCEDRTIVTQNKPIEDYVLLYGGNDVYTVEQIIEHLSKTATPRDYLFALRIGARPTLPNETTLPHRDTTRFRRQNKKLEGEDAHSEIVRRLIERTLALATPDDTMAEHVRHSDTELLALVMNLELLALANPQKLALAPITADNAVQRRVAADVVRQISPLDTAQLNVLLHAPELRPSETTLFPLCVSALVESNGCWRPTAASMCTCGRSHMRCVCGAKRMASLLFAGRTPRPLLGLPPIFMELVFINWYHGCNDEPTT